MKPDVEKLKVKGLLLQTVHRRQNFHCEQDYTSEQKAKQSYFQESIFFFPLMRAEQQEVLYCCCFYHAVEALNIAILSQCSKYVRQCLQRRWEEGTRCRGHPMSGTWARSKQHWQPELRLPIWGSSVLKCCGIKSVTPKENCLRMKNDTLFRVSVC